MFDSIYKRTEFYIGLANVLILVIRECSSTLYTDNLLLSLSYSTQFYFYQHKGEGHVEANEPVPISNIHGVKKYRRLIPNNNEKHLKSA